MASTFQLEIATPERLVVRADATEAQIPARGGYIGVLPEHAPLLSALGAGKLTYQAEGRTVTLVVNGGFVEVLPDHVRVLVNHAEKAEEIDLAAAQEDLRRLQQPKAANPGEAVPADAVDALDDLLHAEARIEVAQGRR